MWLFVLVEVVGSTSKQEMMFGTLTVVAGPAKFKKRRALFLVTMKTTVLMIL